MKRPKGTLNVTTQCIRDVRYVSNNCCSGGGNGGNGGSCGGGGVNQPGGNGQ